MYSFLQLLLFSQYYLKKQTMDDISGVKKTMGYEVNFILLITIPATVGLIVLAKPIVENSI